MLRFSIKKRTIILTVITIFLGGFIVLNWLAYNHAYRMMHFIDGSPQTEKANITNKGISRLVFGINKPRPVAGINVSELKNSTKEIFINCSNGIVLSGWYRPGSDADKLVLLFHGYGSEKSSLLPEADAFHDLGFSTLLIDFGGSGSSSESYTSIGYFEADDVVEAVSYAEENFPHNMLILFGQSMGAAAVLKALHDHKLDVKGIILEGVFDTLLDTVSNRFRIMGLPPFPGAQLLVFWGSVQMGFNGFRHNPLEYAEHIDTPAFVMHGSDDRKALLKEAENVFSQLKGPKVFKKFNNIGHESYTERYPTEWESSVRNFIDGLTVKNNQHQGG